MFFFDYYFPESCSEPTRFMNMAFDMKNITFGYNKRQLWADIDGVNEFYCLQQRLKHAWI